MSKFSSRLEKWDLQSDHGLPQNHDRSRRRGNDSQTSLSRRNHNGDSDLSNRIRPFNQHRRSSMGPRTINQNPMFHQTLLNDQILQRISDRSSCRKGIDNLHRGTNRSRNITINRNSLVIQIPLINRFWSRNRTHPLNRHRRNSV